MAKNGKSGESTALQRQPETLKSLLMRAKGSIAGVLPKHLSAERIIRVALLCVSKDQKLMACSAESILGAVMQASQLGLEVGGVAGHAYLVPFKNRGQYEAQFIPGYRGLIHLVWRAAKIDLDADVVYDADEFDWSRGTEPFLTHKPSLRADRGEFVGAWALARYPDGRMRYEVMSASQIESIRGRSKTGGSDYSPWATDPDEMAKKSVAKRIMKWLPIVDDSLAKAIEADNRAERGEAPDYGDVIDVQPGPAPSSVSTSGIDNLRERGRQEMTDEEKAAIEAEENAQ